MTLFTVLVGCQAGGPQPCAEYDSAEATFERLSQEHLDPLFGHPSFAQAAEAFESVPDHCPRKERARFLADSIRRGLAVRRGEALKREREQAAARALEEEQVERARSRRARSRYRTRSKTGVYCTYKQGPLVEGQCYYGSEYQAKRRCRNLLRSQGDRDGRCSCSVDQTRCPGR